MFETAEIGLKTSKAEYKARVPELRQALQEAQQELRGADFPVIVVFGGVDGAGKGETVKLFHEWLDPRWLSTRAYAEPSQEERERPEYWRYWRDLPPRGRIGFFLSSWYSRPLLDRAYGRIDVPELDERLERVSAFESALAADGALILKFWMHLSKQGQKKRLKALEKDPLQRWRVTDTDWRHWRLYDAFVAAAERTVMKTSTGRAPWQIVEGADPRYRGLTVATAVLTAIRERLAAPPPAPRTVAPAPAPPGLPTVLSTLDMGRATGAGEFKGELARLQGRLNRLHREALERRVSTLVVMEGWDAAGKGGAIRRCVAALDARHCEVIPFAAPTDEERSHHYLWRFWRHLGRAGRVTFFDRSWYGRVLVERVEGFATEAEWRRAYREIVDFEEQLVEHGTALVKVWLHITPEEQLARFRAREETPWKRWKLTEEDWRNRERWPQYEQAVNDLVAHTSTSLAPWTLVEGNDKNFGRLKVLATLCDRLEQVLEGRGR